MAGSDDKRREQRREDIDEQRKRLPDQPGVYMFSDGDGRVVGMVARGDIVRYIARTT